MEIETYRSLLSLEMKNECRVFTVPENLSLETFLGKFTEQMRVIVKIPCAMCVQSFMKIKISYVHYSVAISSLKPTTLSGHAIWGANECGFSTSDTKNIFFSLFVRKC